MQGDHIATTTSKPRIGTEIELKACLWFLDQGYEVFRNICPTGPADILVLDKSSGEVTKIDVKKMSDSERKCIRKGMGAKARITELQQGLSVKILYYDALSGEFVWASARGSMCKIAKGTARHDSVWEVKPYKPAYPALQGPPAGDQG